MLFWVLDVTKTYHPQQVVWTYIKTYIKYKMLTYGFSQRKEERDGFIYETNGETQ